MRRRLLGEKRGRFELSGSNFFPAPDTATAAAWRDTVALLVREHRTLREAIATLKARDLARTVGRGQDTVGSTVRGIAAHDLYHAGQIQLIKRLMRRGHGVLAGSSNRSRMDLVRPRRARCVARQ